MLVGACPCWFPTSANSNLCCRVRPKTVAPVGTFLVFGADRPVMRKVVPRRRDVDTVCGIVLVCGAGLDAVFQMIRHFSCCLGVLDGGCCCFCSDTAVSFISTCGLTFANVIDHFAMEPVRRWILSTPKRLPLDWPDMLSLEVTLSASERSPFHSA